MTKSSSALALCLSFATFFTQTLNTKVTVQKELQTQVFQSFVILNQGVTGYSFTYKPESVHSQDLSGEQFLVIDFQNFEIRD